MPMPDPDLAAIYDSLNSEEPLPASDDDRYVDLSAVRGEMNIARRLVQRITNARKGVSHHLLMGHTKCGKTTELNRCRIPLEVGRVRHGVIRHGRAVGA